MTRQAQMEEMQKTIKEMQARLDELTSQLQAPRRSSQAPDVPSFLEPKVQAPESFDGKSNLQLHDFLAQVRLVFATQPSSFPTDVVKVKYTISFLRGLAFKWVQPYLEKDDPPAWMADFSLFAVEINAVFGNPDPAGDAAYALCKLKQTGSAASYAAEFRALASRLSWGDEALVKQFFDNLKLPVQDELVRTEYPRKLDPLIRAAVRIDNHFYQTRTHVDRLRNTRASPPKRNLPSYPATRPPVPRSAPSDYGDAVPRAARHPKHSYAPRRLTEQEKEFRRKNNLCMYCGIKGHDVSECSVCPQNRPRNTRFAESTRMPTSSGNGQAQM